MGSFHVNLLKKNCVRHLVFSDFTRTFSGHRSPIRLYQQPSK